MANTDFETACLGMTYLPWERRLRKTFLGFFPREGRPVVGEELTLLLREAGGSREP